jgi:HNH endonuclease
VANCQNCKVEFSAIPPKFCSRDCYEQGRRRPLEDRFWEKVEKNKTDCWEWTAAKLKGYGWFNIGGKSVSAHRLSYEMLVGDIPEGLQLDHLCRNRGCVNPDHLEPVTPRVNTLRGEALSAKRSRMTHCIRGHEFTEENTWVSKKNQRRCKKCKAIWMTGFRERKRKVVI